MKKTILFVVNSFNYNIYNRKSAIDSILCSVLEELSSEYIIYVNDVKFEINDNYSTNTVFKLSSSNFFRKYAPSIIKRNYNDFKLIKLNELLFYKIIKSVERPDVIIELMRYGSKIGILLKKHYQIPLITYFDAPAVEERQFFNRGFSFFDRIANQYEDETIESSDQVIVYTQPIIDYWCKRLPNIGKEKFNVFQTLDYSRLDFVDDKHFNDIPIIGFIGSFLKWHRIDILISAYNKIREDGIRAKLLLVGAGEEYENILSYAKMSNYYSDIELTGFVDGEVLKEFRKRIDIGVMSGTHWYCMPTKVFEYGAAKIPSIAPRTKNMQYLFREGEDLMMFEQFNEVELYTAIKQLLQNTEKRKSLGKNLQMIVNQKNSSSIAFCFYNNLIIKALQ